MAKTAVFWDMDDCKIPDGLDVSDVTKNIKMALKNNGHFRDPSISAYGDGDRIKYDFLSAGISFRHFSEGKFLKLSLTLFLV